jgi:hypothetical protein
MAWTIEYRYKDVEDFVEKPIDGMLMRSFSFTFRQLDTLMEKGELPTPNGMLNTGTSATLIMPKLYFFRSAKIT